MMVLGNEKSKRWIHSPDTLVSGRVTYTVKFLGKAEVPEPRGMAMVKMALQKLSFSRQLKRTEGTKPPKVELGINVNSVTISDSKTKENLHNIALHRVSFCADDKGDKRLFAFIAKLDDDKHYCYGLDSLHQANDITLTIGQAFELAYEKFLKDTPSQGGKKVSDMSKRIKELESENTKLRQRIAELEAASRGLQQGGAGASLPTPVQVPIEGNLWDQPLHFNARNVARRRTSSPLLTGGTGPEVIDIFNMQPFVPKLPQPPERSPRRTRVEPFETDPFTAMNFTGVNIKDMMDMQNFNDTHAVLTPSRSKKSDYHILSHPLLRKKRKHDLKPLKWSKKHFSIGMKKRARSSKTDTRAPPARNPSFTKSDNAFSHGLTVSDGSLTLDAFDPLKS